MHGLFYIIEVSPQWYNLILKDTHYCVACGGDLEVFKRTIYKYVRKYKVEDRVYKALKDTESGGRVPPTVYEQRRKDYLSGKHIVFNDLIRGVVSQALKDNRQDTPYHHAKKKVRTVTPPVQVRTSPTPPPPPNEVRVVKKITPRKITRTTAHSGHTTE